MALDPVTVLTLTALLAVIVGLLLILSWAQNRAFSSLAAWGIGNVVGGFAAGGLVPLTALDLNLLLIWPEPFGLGRSVSQIDHHNHAENDRRDRLHDKQPLPALQTEPAIQEE